MKLIAGCLNEYAKEYEKLPKSLNFIGNIGGYGNCGSTTDPSTGDEYEYNIISGLQEQDGILSGEFELCAVFELVADEDSLKKKNRYLDLDSSILKWERHGVGRDCDTEKVMVKDEKIEIEVSEE